MNTQSARQADPSVLGELVEEIFAQLQSGSEIDISQLAREYPQYQDRLRRMIPMLRELNTLDWSVANKHLDDDQLRTAEQKTLGDFRIIRQIGRGGMGIVYEAQQLTIDRKVALKILPLAALVDSRALKRFKNEVTAIATLEHPHIVSVYSVGEERGIHYFAMQLIRGQSLAAVIRELRSRADKQGSITGALISQVVSDLEEEEKTGEGLLSANHPQSHSGQTESDHYSIGSRSEIDQLDETAEVETQARGRSTTVAARITDQTYFRNVVRLILQAANAVQHAHDHGIVHRDIKPGNLLLDGDGNLFVTDFGLARIETGAKMTLTGDVLGTLRYMSPEQILGNHGMVDHRTDIYSLGATIYELLTLQPMWSGNDKAELIRQVSFEEPVRPQKINPAIPVDLETIVLKAISKNPNGRYASVELLGDDLQRWLENKPITARRPTVWQHLSKWSYRHRLLITTAAVATFISLAIGLLLTWNAYNQEAAQRARAQNNYRVAMRTLDDVVDNAAQMERMVDVEGWRRTTLERALEHYAQFANQNTSDPDVRNELLKVREKQAKINLLLENFEQAEAMALAGVDLVRADPDSYDRITAVTVWRRLANAYHQQAMTDLAADAWQNGHDLVQRLIDPGGDLSTYDRLNIANFLRAYAQWQIECGSPSVALQSLHQAARQCDLAIKDRPSEAARYLLGEVKEDIGDHYRRASNDSLATRHYNEALSLAKNLSGTRGHLQLRAKCLRQLGTQLVDDRSTLVQAEAYFRQAVEIYDRLVRDYPWDVYYRGERARLLHILAGALRQQGETGEAQKLLERAAANQSLDLDHKPQRAQHQLFWARQQWTLANITRDLRQFEIARKHYQAALDNFDELGNRWRNYREIHESKALTHNDYANMILAQVGVFGNLPVAHEAEEQILQALNIFKKLQAEFPELKRIDEQFPEISGYYSHHLRNTYTLLAKSLNAQQRYDEGIQALKNAKAEFDRVPRLQSPQSRYKMANTLLDLAGASLMRDDDPVKVEKMYREGLQMITAAYDSDPMVVEKKKYIQELQTHYWGLAQSLYEQQRFAESKEEFEQAYGLGNMWVDGLSFYAGHLLECEDESFQDYRLALEYYQEILRRGPSRGTKDNAFIGQYKTRIGICHYRLGEYKTAKAIFTELLTNPDFSSIVEFSVGYYMSMTLANIAEEDDSEGTFHKSEAREGYDVTFETHQRLLKNGTISGENIGQLERLRKEAAEALGIDDEENPGTSRYPGRRQGPDS